MKIYKSIEENCRHFDVFNGLKYNRFQQLFYTSNVRKIVNSIPALLSLNNKKIPGYVDGKVKFGVYGYMASDETIRYIKGRFGVDVVPPPGRPMIETLAIMGSVGTIAYNKKSDFDYWAVVDKTSATEGEFDNFQKKVDVIQKWAMKESGVEIHIFINDVTNLRSNIFAEDEDEGFGSTVGAVLKDEFFRASLIVAGKIPFWWVVPKFLQDSEYNKLYASLADTEIGARLVDIGNLYKISKEDFLGASLFQLIKAIGSPFKSILKIGILEKYLFGDNKTGLLSQKLKVAMLRGELDKSIPDSYLMMFNEVYKYYDQVLEDKLLLNFLRQNLYLKIDPQLSKYTGVKDSQNIPYKISMMFRVVKNWGWNTSQIKDLDSFESWDYTRVIQFWNYVKKYMLLSYQKISKEIPNLDLKNIVSDTDFKLLRSKIKANFSMEPGKIENYITFKDTPNEPYLYIEPDQSMTKNGGWRVYKKFRTEKNSEVEVNIKSEGSLLMLLAWCSINQIYEPAFSRVFFESGYYHHNKNHIIELLNQIFEMFNAEKVHLKNDSYLRSPITYKNMVILNFGESKSTEIKTFSHLYINSWGESYLKTYSNYSDLVMIFSKTIKDGIFLDKEFEEFCYFVSPEPHKKLYKQVERVFCEAYNFMKKGKEYITQTFITAFEDNLIFLKKNGKDVSVMSFGSFFELLSNLSMSSCRYPDIRIYAEDNQNLAVLEEIFSKRNSNGLSIVYEDKPKYLIVYLMDKNGNLFTFIRKKVQDDLPMGIYKFCENIIANAQKSTANGVSEKVECYSMEFDRFGKFSFKNKTKEIMQLSYLNNTVFGSISIEVFESKNETFYIVKRGDAAVGPITLSALKESIVKLDPLKQSIFEVVDVSFNNISSEKLDLGLTAYINEKYKIEKMLGVTV